MKQRIKKTMKPYKTCPYYEEKEQGASCCREGCIFIIACALLNERHHTVCAKITKKKRG